MKIALVTHGYPPELVGGTEASVRFLAHALARAGHGVLVIAGSIRAAPGAACVREESEDVDDVGAVRGVRVVRLLRGDLHADHWHKSAAPGPIAELRALLRAERPDVVHVHHWIRLSRELVAAAAREGVPAVVSLHDLWTSCLIAFRVRPPALEACEAQIAPHPCIACAARVGPATPWVARESAYMLLAERQRDLARELELARAILVPTASHRAALEGFGILRAGDERVALFAPRPAPDAEELGGSAPAYAAPAPGAALRLGAWGHFAPHKGQDLLLEALARLEPGVAAELELAGDDSDRDFAHRLRERARGLPVRFHPGFATGELARHPVAAVHAFVTAARSRESWSLALDEERALGLPALLPDHGAFAERGREGGALLYAPGQPDALAVAITRLAREPGLCARLAAESRALGRAAESRATWLERVLATYARAMAQGAPAVAAEEWFAARMRQSFLDQWDGGLRARAVAPVPPERS